MWNTLLNLIGLGDPPDVVAAKKRMTADAGDPRRLVVWGILAISYDADPAYLEEHARMAVREWYGIGSAAELEQRVRDYLDGRITGTPGYNVFRAAFLARAGLGAGLLDEARSWELAFEAARAMQRHYRTWQEYGIGYLEGHLDYRAEQGDPPSQLTEIREHKSSWMKQLAKTAWTVPFATSIG